MARATLRHDAVDGDWVLACPRELEAHVFDENRDPVAMAEAWPCAKRR